MNIVLLALGRPKYPFFAQACEHYSTQIRHHWKLEIIELRDAEGGDIEKESAAIRDFLEKKKLLSDGKVKKVLLEERGKSFTSVQWAEKLRQWQDAGASQIIFILGGAYGFSPAFKKEIGEHLTLSDFTFPHDLARLVLLEQVYRAQMILAGKKYHHA